MRKKLFSIILLVGFIQILSLTNDVQSFECYPNYLETDKDSYYPDENIIINASWYLDYNNISESAYVQLQIFNSLNEIIWNSSKYDESRIYTESWIINITHLDFVLSNYSDILNTKLFCYVKPHEGVENTFFLEIIRVNIVKRISVCQLIGFKDFIKYGELFAFKARFYDEQNNSLPHNQLINFKVFSNNSLVYHSNFTTDHSGTIEIYLLPSHLKIGLNLLLLSLSNNSIYNNSIVFNQIFVEKSPVFIDIGDFDGSINTNEDLELDLFYYYFFNNSLTPLYNQSVEFLIRENETVIHSEIFRTDMTGKIKISVSEDIFSNTKSSELKIDITLNSTESFDYLSISLNLEISNSEIKSGFNSSIFTVLSVSIVSSLILLLVYKKHKIKRKIILSDIIIRY